MQTQSTTTITPSSSALESISGYERSARRNQKYPPPIPYLILKANGRSYMPWVLTRCYQDGRLVMNMVKKQRHEFLRAHRANGRLTLHLVSLNLQDFVSPTTDDDDDDDHDHEEAQLLSPPQPSSSSSPSSSEDRQ